MLRSRARARRARRHSALAAAQLLAGDVGAETNNGPSADVASKLESAGASLAEEVQQVADKASEPVGANAPTESEGERRERISGEYRAALASQNRTEQALGKARGILGKGDHPDVDQRLYPNEETLSRHERVRKALEILEQTSGGGDRSNLVKKIASKIDVEGIPEDILAAATHAGARVGARVMGMASLSHGARDGALLGAAEAVRAAREAMEAHGNGKEALALAVKLGAQYGRAAVEDLAGAVRQNGTESVEAATREAHAAGSGGGGEGQREGGPQRFMSVRRSCPEEGGVAGGVGGDSAACEGTDPASCGDACPSQDPVCDCG